MTELFFHLCSEASFSDRVLVYPHGASRPTGKKKVESQLELSIVAKRHFSVTEERVTWRSVIQFNSPVTLYKQLMENSTLKHPD